MLICPWVSYLIAEGLELSPIVSILTTGITLNYYGTPNISLGSEKVMKVCVDTLAYVTETMVFLFLGIGVFAIDHPYEKMGTTTLILSIVNFNLSRFLNITLVTYFVNKSRSIDTKINGK